MQFRLQEHPNAHYDVSVRFEKNDIEKLASPQPGVGPSGLYLGLTYLVATAREGAANLLRVAHLPSGLAKAAPAAFKARDLIAEFTTSGVMAVCRRGSLDLLLGEQALEALRMDGKYVAQSGPIKVRVESDWYDSNTSQWRVAA